MKSIGIVDSGIRLIPKYSVLCTSSQNKEAEGKSTSFSFRYTKFTTLRCYFTLVLRMLYTARLLALWALLQEAWGPSGTRAGPLVAQPVRNPFGRTGFLSPLRRTPASFTTGALYRIKMFSAVCYYLLLMVDRF